MKFRRIPAKRSGDRVEIRAFTPEHTARALRAHFARHNLQVLVLAFVTLLAAALLWTLLYGACCWMILLALTAADFPVVAIPRGFRVGFAAVALGAIFFSWLDRRLRPNDFPRDAKSAAEVFLDFALAVPRMTLSVAGTLRAWQWLNRSECALAAAFLHRLARAQKVPLAGIPLELPDENSREKILFALQLTRVIDLRQRDCEWWIALNSSRPPNLRLASVR